MKTKTRIFALLMVLVLALSCSSVTAFAAEWGQQSSGSTTVSYTLRGQYSITIPSSVCITYGDRLKISPDYLHLIEGEKVVISVSRSSFDDSSPYSEFILHSVEGNSTIPCLVMVGLEGCQPEEMYAINRENAIEVPVHTYTAENASDVVEIDFIPNAEPHSAAGDYTGTLQFDIAFSIEPENVEG